MAGSVDAVLVTAGVRTSEAVRCYRFLASAAALALRVGPNISFGPDHLQAQAGLTVPAVMRRLRFPAMRMVQLPRCPQVLEETIQSMMMQPEQREQQQKIE